MTAPKVNSGIRESSTQDRAEPARLREAALRFEALLFESALKPLADSLGFFGEAAVGAAALAMARGAHDRLGALLEAGLAREAR